MTKDELFTAVMDCLAPNDGICLYCSRYSGDDILCSVCHEDLDDRRLQEPLCPHCGEPLPPDREHRCSLPPRLSARSVWHYDSLAGWLIRQLKFHHVLIAARPLTEGMAALASSLDLNGIACVTWVSMPPSRRRDRGYDQAQVLAEGLAQALGLPCRQLLLRPDKVEHQVGLNGEERRRNLQGTFTCAEDLPQGGVILVDDVYTTGATIAAAAQCLLDGGVSRVLALTAARAGVDW